MKCHAILLGGGGHQKGHKKDKKRSQGVRVRGGSPKDDIGRQSQGGGGLCEKKIGQTEGAHPLDQLSMSGSRVLNLAQLRPN